MSSSNETVSARLTLTGEVVRDLRQWLTARGAGGQCGEGDEFLRKLLERLRGEDHVVFTLRSELDANPNLIEELRELHP